MLLAIDSDCELCVVQEQRVRLAREDMGMISPTEQHLQGAVQCSRIYQRLLQLIPCCRASYLGYW